MINNFRLLDAALGIRPEEIVYDNPFFQKKTQLQLGCQIHYLIQKVFNTLYVCEIKFSTDAIGADVVREVQEKISRLKIPKGFSIRPVLIHVNDVTHAVKESGFFSHIIAFGNLL